MRSQRILLTLEEFERWLDQAGKSELLEGELIQSQPAQVKHHEAAERLADLLRLQWPRMKAANPRTAFGKVHHEMGYLVMPRDPASWLQPGVSVTWPDQLTSRFYQGSPMLAFEIVCDSGRTTQVARKRRRYLECGAAEVWVIYPETRYAMVFTKAGERCEEAAVHSDLLPGVEILFADFLLIGGKCGEGVR